LRAQKSVKDESCTIALNNLRTEVIELRNEGLEKDKILISLVDKIKEDETKYNAQAEAQKAEVEDLQRQLAELMRNTLSQSISKRSVNIGEKS
jgi:phage host-nuclease inhibitor protein Gam